MSDYKKIVFLLFLGILNAKAYVLVQVRKDQNKSNVDALIHKVVPSKKFEEIAETARKQFKNFKQFTIKHKPNDKELDSIVFAIKTDEQNGRHGARQDGGRRQNDGQAIENLVMRILNFFMPDTNNLPNYKSKMQKYNIKPELVNFRDGKGKPSLMYEIDTNSILTSVKELLRSKKFKKYTDKLVDQAAIVYRTLKQELDKEY